MAGEATAQEDDGGVVTSYGRIRLGNVSLPWRGIECWGVPIALYLQSDATGGLSANVILLPAFAITVMLVANNIEQILLTLRHRPLITFLFVLPFLSVAWSTSGSISLRRALALTLSMALAYIIAIRFTPRQFLFVIVAALFPALLFSLVLLVVAPSTVRMPDGSISGLFSHKNLLGWHAAVALLAGAILTWEGAVSRRLGLIVVATSLVCLLASGSATGLLSVLVALLLVLFFRQLKRLKGIGRVALVLLTLNGAGAAYFIGSEIVVPSLAALGKDTSLTGRVPMWRLEDEAIAQKPLLGYGYQAFWSGGSSAGWKIKAEIDWGSPNAHSGYRDILLSFGLLGFVPFMVLVVRTLVKGASLHIAAPDNSWLGLNVLIGMLLTINVTESIFYMPYNFLFIIFVAALLMISIRKPDFYVPRQVTGFSPATAALSYSRR
jgi:exopolysaccharide production protein ExoQ